MDIKEILFELSNSDAVGYVTEARDIAYTMLSKYCECKKSDTLNVFGYLKGESDYTVMLDAHIDQIAFIVTDVDDNGFLTVSNVGGIDLRQLPSRRVIIHGKQKVTGVFVSTPPHLGGKDTDYSDITAIKIDTALGNNAKDIISVGDIVTFATEPISLLGDRVSGKSFDDRAGCAVIIETAKRLSKEKLPVNVAFLLSDKEEIGQGGAKTGAFRLTPDEAVILDVSFGDTPGIAPEKTGELTKGAMIGISPLLDKAMSDKLMSVASSKNLPYQTEVMSGNSGTNADVIAVTKEGVKTATVSIPLRNMHTDCEILSVCDLENTVELLCEYIRNGGVKNA